MELNITVTPTAVGNKQYIQIMSDDAVSVNIVLVVDKININDARSHENKVEERKNICVKCHGTGRFQYRSDSDSWDDCTACNGKGQ